MQMWILELYDNWFSCPITTGIFSTEEKAFTASRVLLNQMIENGMKNPEDRYDVVIEPAYLDVFIDSALGWIAE